MTAEELFAAFQAVEAAGLEWSGLAQEDPNRPGQAVGSGPDIYGSAKWNVRLGNSVNHFMGCGGAPDLVTAIYRAIEAAERAKLWVPTRAPTPVQKVNVSLEDLGL